MCLLIFSSNSVWKSSHSKKNSARYDRWDHKCTKGFLYNTRYSCQIFIKLEFSRQIFKKYADIKFHENPSSGSQVVLCAPTVYRQKDRHDKTTSRFRSFAKAPNKTKTELWNLHGYCYQSWTESAIRGGADKFLARPERKQATATKLGIYSTHFPRSSIHFLARCSNFCKPLKKKIRSLSVQPGLRGNNELCVGRKMANFPLYFQSSEQVVVRRGQIRRIGWVIKTLEAQVGQFLLGCKCLVSWGTVVQE